MKFKISLLVVSIIVLLFVTMGCEKDNITFSGGNFSDLLSYPSNFSSSGYGAECAECGGYGWSEPESIDSSSCDTTITNVAGLITAINSSQINSIFVKSGIYDLTDVEINVNHDGKIIAGQMSDGHTIFRISQAANNYEFNIRGNGVRVTSIEFDGDYNYTERGLTIYGDNTEVDNCYFNKWRHFGVSVKENSTLNDIHHNNFYHNNSGPRDNFIGGNGYAVSVSNLSNAAIHNNLFFDNRDNIAAPGGLYCSYEAYCNYTIQSNVCHNSYDMHGWVDKDYSPPWAGGYIFIHHNTILRNSLDKRAITIKGRPGIAIVSNNKFDGWDNQVSAVQQWYSFGNMIIDNNEYDSGIDANDNDYSLKCAWSGHDTWNQLRSLSFTPYNVRFIHDDDDKVYALFEGCSYRHRFLNGQGLFCEERTTPTGISGLNLDQTHIGDFDGDGNEDLFYVNGSNEGIVRNITEWSSSPTEYVYASSSPSFNNLGFGDFDGDGTEDIFKAEGGYWYVKFSPSGPWTKVGKSAALVSDLVFGDFDGTGTTDVLKIKYFPSSNRYSWQVSLFTPNTGMATSWYTVNYPAPSDVTIDKLAAVYFDDFCDHNENSWAYDDPTCDIKADLLFTDGTTWYWFESSISWGPSGTFGTRQFRNASSLLIGDFVLYNIDLQRRNSDGMVTSYSNKSTDAIRITRD